MLTRALRALRAQATRGGQRADADAAAPCRASSCAAKRVAFRATRCADPAALCERGGAAGAGAVLAAQPLAIEPVAGAFIYRNGAHTARSYPP